MNDMTSIPTLRPAQIADAPQLAQFLNAAGDGIPLEHWQGLAEPGLDPWDVGAARISAETGINSWRHWTVAERGGTVAGGLCTYELGPEPEEITADTPQRFRRMIELETIALGTWHIHVLATTMEARRSGFGRTLLARAAEQAGERTQSLIVDDGNAPGCALYLSRGFAEVARRPILNTSGKPMGGNWLLLIR